MGARARRIRDELVLVGALSFACADDSGSAASGSSESNDASDGTGDGDTTSDTADTGATTSADTTNADTTSSAETTESGSESGGSLSVELQGAVAKGPFVLGSSIEASALDSTLSPTGDVFATQTINDLGEFELAAETSGLLSIEAVGFYYNEVTGDLSNAALTLRAFYEASRAGTQPAFVNVVTHLGYGRVQQLVGDGVELTTAVAQAEDELLAALGVGVGGFDPGAEGTAMNLLGGDTDANAYLFAVATVLAQAAVTRAGGPEGPVDANLQELVNTISSDLQMLGQISPALGDELLQAQRDVDPAAVMAAFAARLEMLGSNADVPDLDRILDTDLDSVVNADDNCRLVENTDQVDTDVDGVGDACECGNGVVDLGEVCDDDNAVAFDGCEPDCTPSCVAVFSAQEGEALWPLGLIGDVLVFALQTPENDYEPLAHALGPMGDAVELGAFGGELHALDGIHVALGNTAATAGVWVTDGTPAGTSNIAEIDTGTGTGFVLDDVFLFGSGSELWSSDGTAGGTFSLGTGAPLVAAATLGGSAYFRGHPNVSDSLWITDGTSGGTQLVHDFAVLTGFGQALVALPDSLLTHSTAVQGQPLWVSDGTPGGTTNVVVAMSLFGNSADMFAVLDGVAYFGAADDGVAGLWRSDGTAAQTYAVETFGPDTGDVLDFQVTGDRVAFIRRIGGADDELWTSDGTPAGTAPLATSFGEILGGYPAIGGYYYFVADDGDGATLWRTDGTLAGTTLVFDAGDGGSESYGQPLPGNGYAYLSAVGDDGIGDLAALYRCAVPM